MKPVPTYKGNKVKIKKKNRMDLWSQATPTISGRRWMCILLLSGKIKQARIPKGERVTNHEFEKNVWESGGDSADLDLPLKTFPGPQRKEAPRCTVRKERRSARRWEPSRERRVPPAIGSSPRGPAGDGRLLKRPS